MELALVFSHPFDNGFTMNMGKPEEFYVVAQRGEGDPKKTDLMQYLEPIEWSGVDSKAAAPARASGPRNVATAALRREPRWRSASPRACIPRRAACRHCSASWLNAPLPRRENRVSALLVPGRAPHYGAMIRPGASFAPDSVWHRLQSPLCCAADITGSQ